MNLKKYRAVAVAMITVAAAAAFAAPQKAKPKPKAAKPDATEIARQAADAAARYDFDKLEDLADQLTAGSHLADSLARMARIGQGMLERVEKIVVIDSINVDADKFFEAYRLSPSAGSFVKSKSADTGNSPVYITETGITTLFAHRDTEQAPSQIAQARVLADGQTEAPRIYPNAEGIEQAAYPYLLTDGLTLYFAATGEQSLGGYDIFITRRGSVDDDFLQPQNLGMPYNSPYNDYLMVIDEATGLGWWATDRNQIEGKVTIYVFRPEELRVNLSPDDDNLLGLAALRSISDTWPSDFVKPDINSIVAQSGADGDIPEFEIALPDGRVLTRRSQLGDSRTLSLVQDYKDAEAEAEADRLNLEKLRARYAAGDKGAEAEILRLEQKMEGWPQKLLKISNEIVRAESK